MYNKNRNSFSRLFLFASYFVLFLALSTKQSFAASFSFESILCNVYSLFSGQWGKIFALFALIALGISFFLGKISWGTVLAVAIGVALIFGGTAIVDGVLGGSASVCASSTN